MSTNIELENESINWIEEAITKNYFKYYDYKHFSNIQEICSGVFGKVYRTNWKNSQRHLALKSFFNFNNATCKEIVNEFKLQQKVDFHDNIIRFCGVTKENDNSEKYLLVIEYADGGTLQNYLKDHSSNLTWNDKFNLALQLAHAVSYLHDEEIVHRDLHSKNILIHQNTIKETPFPNTPKDYVKIYTDCWNNEPDNRPTISQDRLSDEDRSVTVQLVVDISRLQDDLEIYVTNLRPNININYKNAVLQRHVLETIFGYVPVYNNIKNFKFGKTREGNDSITPTVPVKIRQQIYSSLGNRGFSNIMIEQETYEHSFIGKFKTKLNDEMEQYREILDTTKKKEVEEKAANIILNVIRIFFFRIQTQEPIGQIHWFQNKDKIDPSLMVGMWDDDDKFDDFEVDICKFPLVRTESNDKLNRRIYTYAIIHPQKKVHSQVNSDNQ
ncbi:kinase-like domain-containing protein [Rhizophagus irregularis DAOM 181602=DAOM 197198]|nr:kinase-like domain-containing protein [Rhizophagus irregularis DAOM 181602=DAOM 197198]